MVGFSFEFTEDPADFLERAGEWLARDPLLTTVVSTVTQRSVQEDLDGVVPSGEHRWWVSVVDGGEVVGVAMRTAPAAPQWVYLLPMPAAAARGLAEALLARGERVTAVNGALPAAKTFLDTVARAGGRTTRVRERNRLFVLDELVEPAAVPGRLVTAGEHHAQLALAWFRAFHVDAAVQAGRSPDDGDDERFGLVDIMVRISAGLVCLWEVDGEVVHLTGFNAPSFGVGRIGPVYTPAEHRGHGYASAAVAEVSRRLIAAGARPCLFTDQANPTSNKIYQALGYRPVVDMASLSLA